MIHRGIPSISVDPPKQMDDYLAELFSQYSQEEFIRIVSNPVDWAETLLVIPTTKEPVRINHVERLILTSPHRRNVIRVHRRAGKSYSLSILALYSCLTTNAYQVMVVGPAGIHVSRLFETIRRFISANSWIRDFCVASDTKSPHHLIEFENGSTIAGFTTGAKLKGKGDALRGGGADLILIDEAQLLEEMDWQSAKPIIKGDKYRRKKPIVFAAGTPAFTRGTYYDLCKHPESKKLWNEIYVPITENPDQTEEDIAEARGLCNSEQEWIMEWLADFPDFGSGVFPRIQVERIRKKYSYAENYEQARRTRHERPPTRTIGVDWDKHNKDGHGPTIAVIEAIGNGKFRVVYREEIPQSSMSLKNATKRVIELNDIFNPEWIYIDRGYGEFQYEVLQDWGLQYPHTGLARKTIGVTFADLVECPLPRGGVTKKRFKQVMVSLFQKWVEEEKLEICSSDSQLFSELVNYRVIGKTEQALKFSTENEHSIDAIGLAIMAIHQKVENPYAPKYISKPIVVPAPEVVPSKLLREYSGGIDNPTLRSWAGGGSRSSYSRGYLGDRPPSDRSAF